MMGDSVRAEPIGCPHCDEVTMPNRLADGSIVCSCAAERPLPAPPPPVAAAPRGTK